ncbi:hypothetical protein C5167_033632 [Papaver somniferum]|uniref:MLO-like protein n=1 Tax=Papaver somniferum TaxID=3469 RepID=A0A4Y7KAH3_PAPSO|nr:hypothetical protein C5167_033632 [Papaver somniferum]
MAGGGGTGRSLEQTPTWAVAVVCFALVLISIIIEHIIHLIGKWFQRKHKKALYEAFEKIKSELMLLGFLSLLLTVGQGPISKICIPKSVAATWHPCSGEEETRLNNNGGDKTTSSNADDNESEDVVATLGRKLLSNISRLSSNSTPSHRRVLAGGSTDGKVPFVSSDGIHQLHIFISVLAISHVLYCILTMALGRLKMRRWKSWEKETRTIEYEFTQDPERFRFARDTSFGRRHLNFWSKSPVLIWVVCFFRQFVRSVPKVDYLTLRHGFIMAHLSPQSSTKFNFQKYINRSLEEDFKVVVGISPPIWFFAVLFLLFNTHGWFSYLWLPFIPFIIILLVGTKLQVIITRMGLRIQEKSDIVRGVPVVQPADDLFWFSRPRLILYLIHFVLFQNAFQLAFFVWTWWEFGLKSCFHEHIEDVVIRISMGVLIQILCSYVTLPLYALVTQMGSSMKSTIFNDSIATALRKWHHTAKKQIKQNQRSRTVTPMSSRPGTPTHGTSPIHLLRYYRQEADSSLQTSPRLSNIDNENWDSEGSPSPMHQHEYQLDSPSSHKHHFRSNLVGPTEEEVKEFQDLTLSDLSPPSAPPATSRGQHEIDVESSRPKPIMIGSKDFSFDKR